MSEEEFLRAALGMKSRLYRSAMAILWNEQDAADAVQEAMLKGWRHRESLRDGERFEAWFMRILVNQCRDSQRRLLRRRRLMQAAARAAEAEDPPAPPATELFEAIRALPEEQRMPLLLYYFDGYSQKETARILGISPGQVKDRVHRARGRLKKLLTDDGDGEGRRMP